MKVAGDLACTRCRAALEPDDQRPWATTEHGELVCPGCVSPRDRARGCNESCFRTHVARLAAGHEAAIEMTTSVLGGLVARGNEPNAYGYLRTVGEEPLHGQEALAQLVLALLDRA